MDHVRFWTVLVGARWPAAARDLVGSEASYLCERLDVLTKDRPPRPGMLALLQTLRRTRIPAGIVSNALAGAGSRKLMHDYGFEPYFGAQIYSDEVGVRKPNPKIFACAATALGVDLGRCWYVGDTYDRDVLGGRRAGVGRVILMRSAETAKHGHPPVEPDATVALPADVARMLDEIAV
jgi:HAD superfamily hydrolase (TIGR01549 family)